jgi:hypothetical protein
MAYKKDSSVAVATLKNHKTCFQMNQEDTIPLVHAYCDNWCERCPFTAKCAVFAREQAWRDSKDSISDSDVFEYVEKSLGEALDKMMHIIEERGLDLDDIGTEGEHVGDSAEPSPEVLEELKQTENTAKRYGFDSLKWMISKNTMFEEYRDVLLQKQDLGLAIDEVELAELANAVDEIQWYAHFIGAKIHRIADQLQEPFIFDDIQNDANGSAKVVLIAIARSIRSWEVMIRDFPEQLNEIISFLSLLQQIQTVVNRLFPHSAAFHRPGFDD